MLWLRKGAAAAVLLVPLRRRTMTLPSLLLGSLWNTDEASTVVRTPARGLLVTGVVTYRPQLFHKPLSFCRTLLHTKPSCRVARFWPAQPWFAELKGYCSSPLPLTTPLSCCLRTALRRYARNFLCAVFSCTWTAEVTRDMLAALRSSSTRQHQSHGGAFQRFLEAIERPLVS